MCQRKRLTGGEGKHEPAWVTFHIWFVKLLYCPLRHCKRKKWRWRLWYVWVILFCWVPLSVWVLWTVKQYASLCFCASVHVDSYEGQLSFPCVTSVNCCKYLLRQLAKTKGDETLSVRMKTSGKSGKILSFGHQHPLWMRMNFRGCNYGHFKVGK